MTPGPAWPSAATTAAAAYQQVNVGDIMCQYQDATWGSIAIPVAAARWRDGREQFGRKQAHAATDPRGEPEAGPDQAARSTVFSASR